MTKEQALSAKKWAVVGANENKAKFGNKIYRRLKQHGYEVYPVNPGLETVDGDKCYAKLADIPVKIEVVDFVVPEKIGLTTLDEMKELGIDTAFLQPNTDSKAVLNKAQELGISAIQGCVLVELANR